jgi:hypothetical protein
MSVPTPNSSTGGYLVPDAAAPPPFLPPLEGEQLEDLFQTVICGIIGFTSNLRMTLVRPRFQIEPPAQPDPTVDWVAFGFQNGKADFDPFLQHSPDYYGVDAGADISQQDEELELFLSFYGPNARAIQRRFEDGIKIKQNREPLDAQGIKYMGTRGDAYRLPALLKQRWNDRWDQKMVFRRRVFRVYPILNFASASVHSLDNGQWKEDINVNPPSP